jgi:SpoVK/Ycf46/Vps4 family AAA+-type ATPase
MLPKVAELWHQRRVLFFVATNDIAHADRAIKRSQRFDAAIFVPPASLDVKLDRLREMLGKEKAPRVPLADVEDALRKSAAENPLGYLALLRYDQIDELAAKLSPRSAARRRWNSRCARWVTT